MQDFMLDISPEFKQVGIHLVRDFFCYKGRFMMRVYDYDIGDYIWIGEVPKIQFYRAFHSCLFSTYVLKRKRLYSKKVAYLTMAT